MTYPFKEPLVASDIRVEIYDRDMICNWNRIIVKSKSLPESLKLKERVLFGVNQFDELEYLANNNYLNPVGIQLREILDKAKGVLKTV